MAEKKDFKEKEKEKSACRTIEGDSRTWFKTGIKGFDDLFAKGIPCRNSNLVIGGPGSGKTIFCLQTCNNVAQSGGKALYMSFEESEERLRTHMHDFGWNPEELEKRGRLMIKRFDLFEVASQIEAMLEKAKGELYIDLKPLLVPKGFTPDVVIVDSLSAVSSVFTAKEETYRVYIEQLFRLLEDAGVTAFLIAESSDFDKKFTSTGVEEFLADGVILIYNLRQGSVRQSGIEILKMRGAAFEKKMAAMTIKPGQGIVVYPDQELFVE